jgi:hypothetical protein
VADEDISEEARMLAVDALARARLAPDAGMIRGLERDALSAGRGEMSAADIRTLAATAADQAEQVSALMTRLAVLLGETPGGARGQ